MPILNLAGLGCAAHVRRGVGVVYFLFICAFSFRNIIKAVTILTTIHTISLHRVRVLIMVRVRFSLRDNVTVRILLIQKA